MPKIIYLPFDQLHRNFGALKGADPSTDQIVMIESLGMVQKRNWHPIRLHFLIASARHFAEDLRAEGFKVHYERAASIQAGLASYIRSGTQVICTEPSSLAQHAHLQKLGIEFVENDFFLTPRPLFQKWAQQQKSFLMESFYRLQRQRLDILMEENQPVGGIWNFDKENRLPPPKKYQWQPYFSHTRDEIDLQVADELNISIGDTWATTRAGALAQLEYFVDVHLPAFGPYEDAMTTENWALHHSLLSPYLNNGLLHPQEVVDAVIKKFNSGEVPIESIEGFVRQIIGWREYINGMYWFLGQDYRNQNQLEATRELLPLFTDPTKTSMNCMKENISDIQERAWVHHIPRLMILSNLALLTGTSPQAFLDWMRESFIDAADWVMVPNVIGMGVHADGGKMMTKPYAAGGAYISRMSNYCKGCEYNPKLRSGDQACPFTTLYWDFLDRHRDAFSKNHRMRQQYFGLERLTDLPEVRERAQEVLRGLSRGEI